MTDQQPQSEWARKRAAGKARHAARLRRSQEFFELIVSGYSVEQIAEATKTSASAVRRAMNQALAKRRLDAPEHFARLQVARLNKALCYADMALAERQAGAVSPYLAVLVELNRFYGFAVAGPLRFAPSAAARKLSSAQPTPLALPQAAPPLEGAGAEALESCVREVITD